MVICWAASRMEKSAIEHRTNSKTTVEEFQEQLGVEYICREYDEDIHVQRCYTLITIYQ